MGIQNTTPNIPNIVVQIVHIEGARKGEIDEIDKSRITIGRHPSCDVVFPKNLRIISRHHAEINREGNRFLLKNMSKNGCYVNGHLVSDAYLKQGDVITFADGGPKVSFLYSVQTANRSKNTRPSPQTTAPSSQTTAPRAPQSAVTPATTGESAPFTVQYGTSIRSFKQRSITIGKDASNHFVLQHPRVLGKHAEVFFQQNQYYLRDLSGCSATLLNGRPLNVDTPLHENDILTFSENGPQLQYLGTGRLAEYFETAVQSQASVEIAPFSNVRAEPARPREPSVKDLFKSFFKK